MGKKIDTSRLDRKPRYKLGRRYVDETGQPWRYYHMVNADESKTKSDTN